MRLRFRVSLGLLALLAAIVPVVQSQARGGDPDTGYRLQLPVDEVVLTFHAMDAAGQPVNDLKESELKLWDNGVPPRRIVAFEALLNRPLKAAILMDSSESMAADVSRARMIANEFVRSHMGHPGDGSLVGEFAYSMQITQQWTNDSVLLERGIANARPGTASRIGGTAIFSALYQGCTYHSDTADPTTRGNFILLLSDGEDTAGLTTLEEVLRSCQRTNTVIYAFRFRHGDHDSTGPKTLAELTSKTGGEVFPADDSDEAIRNDLNSIESRMRNEYRLVYNPANFKHDGTFHEIEIQPPDRVSRIEVRSGYYAPVR